MFRENFAQAFRYALIWIVIALVLVVGYTYRQELAYASTTGAVGAGAGASDKQGTNGRTRAAAERRLSQVSQRSMAPA